MKRITVLVPVLGGLILVISLLGIGLVNAQEASKHFPFVEKLAQKLSLSEEKVQKAVDEIHAEQKVELDKMLEERLSQAVKEGKITEEQKKALMKKLSERKVYKVQGSSVSAEGSAQGKVVVHEQGKSDFETWAEENGLTMELIRELLGGGGPMIGTFPNSGAVPAPAQ